MSKLTELTVIFAISALGCGQSPRERALDASSSPEDGTIVVGFDGQSGDGVDNIDGMGATPDAVARVDAQTVALCGPADMPRPIKFHLQPPPGVTVPPVTDSAHPVQLDIVGTLVDVARVPDPCAGCSTGTTVAVRLTLDAADQKQWILVIAPQGAVDDWEATARSISGKKASLMFRYRRGFQYPPSSGFVLRGPEEELVMAADQGPWVTVINAEDVPFSMTRVSAACQAPVQECFTKLYFNEQFSAQTSVTLGLDRDGEFTVGNRAYRARNAGLAELTHVICTDEEVGSFWAVWRVSSRSAASVDAGLADSTP